jgi:RNA polymerase sigma factor (sigma-70 family)
MALVMNTAACSTHPGGAPGSVHSPETSRGSKARSMVAPWLTGRAVLMGLCLRWTRGNRAEAEDLLGDACLRILEGGYREGAAVGSPIAFWATVINNLGRDRFRQTRRWKIDGQCDHSSLLGDLPAPTISAEQQLLLRECLTATARNLTRLTDNQRNAVLLRGRGIDYSGIGKALNTTAANARKLVETARRFLNAAGPREARSGRGGVARPVRSRRSYLVES